MILVKFGHRSPCGLERGEPWRTRANVVKFPLDQRKILAAHLKNFAMPFSEPGKRDGGIGLFLDRTKQLGILLKAEFFVLWRPGSVL